MLQPYLVWARLPAERGAGRHGGARVDLRFIGGDNWRGVRMGLEPTDLPFQGPPPFARWLNDCLLSLASANQGGEAP
jgi:hypothetical protein